MNLKKGRFISGAGEKRGLLWPVAKIVSLLRPFEKEGAEKEIPCNL